MSSESRPRASRFKRVLLLAVPALVLLFSAAALLVSGSRLRHERAAVLPQAAAPAEAELAADNTVPEPRTVQLKAFSSSGDLYVYPSDLEAAPEQLLRYTVVAPDGALESFAAAEDGSLYLSGLTPGLYTVRLESDGAYTALPAAIQVLPAPAPASPQNGAWLESEGRTYYLGRGGEAVTGLRQIDGRLYYFDFYGVKAKKLGIDVSYHNKGINWPAVKAAGIDFAILRVGYRGYETGLLWEDERFVQNLRGAKAAGLALGVYVYSTAVNPVEARQEADLVIRSLGGVALDYPVFFDTEQSDQYPLGRADRLSQAARAQIVRAFCDRVRDAGCTPGVYSGINFLKNHLAYSSYSPYYTWLANYTRRNRLPIFPYPYDMWQFTSAGRVNGVRGAVDMNVILQN